MEKMFVDPKRPGIIRWNDDPLTGILAGVKAAEIVEAVNNYDRLRAEVQQCALEMEEAANLIAPNFPRAATLFSTAAARARATLEQITQQED